MRLHPAILLCAAAALISPLRAEPQKEPGPAPMLVCEEATYDLGQADSLRDIEHTFVLKNQGAATIAVQQVRSGCGCTKAEAADKTVAPGGTTKVAVHMSLRGRSGPQRFSVYVHSNDPQRPILSLQCTVTVVTEVEIVPSRLEVRVWPDDPPPAESLTLTNRSAEPMHVLRVESPSPLLAATVVTNEDGRAYQIEVRAMTNRVSQLVATELRILTDHPRHPSIIVPVTISAGEEVMIIPAEVLFVERDGAAQHEMRYVLIRSGRDRQFNVLSVESTLPGDVPVSVQSSEKGWCRLQVGPTMPSPKIDGAMIQVKTDLKGSEVIKIPVRLLTPHPSR